MSGTKRQPMTEDEAERRASAFAAWMMSNVRREIAAGRVRATVDETGERRAIN